MSLVNTRLQNWRVEAPDFDKNSTRAGQYGALDFFVEQTKSPTSIIPADVVERVKSSIGNTVQIPVINYDSDVVIANSRSCVFADLDNTSALYNVIFVTYATGFTMVPAAYMNNEISYEHDWRRKIEKISRALAASLDSAAVASLEANKTLVLNEALSHTFAAGVVDVAATEWNNAIGDVNSMQNSNNFGGLQHIIGNFGTEGIVRRLSQYATYNEVNKSITYEDKVLHYTSNIANATGKRATFFAVEDGNVAMLTRYDRETVRGTKSNGHEWALAELPYVGVPVGVHYSTAVGNQSGIAGAATADLTCAVKEYFGFSLDAAFVVAYNSDSATVPSPILKIEVAA